MTSFRYHVVSLAAVFLALAIGVVLGSGPLRTAFVGDLTDQVNALERELDDSQAELAQQQEVASVGEQFAEEVEPALLGGMLDGTSVALVAMLDASTAELDQVRDALVTAGAQVVADVRVEEAWTDPGQTTFRAALAEQLSPTLTGIESDAGAVEVLGHALAQALLTPTVDADEGDGVSATDEGQVLLELLKQGDLVTGTVSSPAETIVVVSGDAADDEDALAAASVVLSRTVGALVNEASGVVVAGGPEATGTLTGAVRNSPEASDASTVTGAFSAYGRISVALALAEQRDGGAGHYGIGDGLALIPSDS